MINILRSEQVQRLALKSSGILVAAFFPFMALMGFVIPENPSNFFLYCASFLSHCVPIIKVLSVGSFSPHFALLYGAASLIYVIISIFIPNLLIIFGFSSNSCEIIKRDYQGRIGTNIKSLSKSWAIGALMTLAIYILPYIHWFPVIGFLNGAGLSKQDLSSGLGGGMESFDLVMLSLYNSKIALFVFYTTVFGWLMLFVNFTILFIFILKCKGLSLYDALLRWKNEI